MILYRCPQCNNPDGLQIGVFPTLSVWVSPNSLYSNRVETVIEPGNDFMNDCPALTPYCCIHCRSEGLALDLIKESSDAPT